jgi:GMP synthase-like glutamine amidotransferase
VGLPRIHYIQHVPFEDPASILDWAESRELSMKGSHLYQDASLPEMDDFDVLVIMGGPMSVNDEDRYPWLTGEFEFVERALASGKRFVGVCLGAQVLARVLGAKVERAKEKEIGWFPVSRTLAGSEVADRLHLPDSFDAFHWHGETFTLPPGSVHIFRSEACENQAFIYDNRALALQFHLESTLAGVELLLEHAADDLAGGGAFVEDPETIRSQTTSKTLSSRPLMEQMLDAFILHPFHP